MHYDVTPIEGIDPQLGVLLASLDEGTREWRGELGEQDQEAVVWQPAPGAQSVGALILHMVEAELFWLREVAAGEAVPPADYKAVMADQIDQYAGQWPSPPRQPLSWFFAKHDAMRGQTHAIVRRLNDPEHVGKRGERGERSFTLRWILQHVLTHEAYHGGQAVLLMLQRARQG